MPLMDLRIPFRSMASNQTKVVPFIMNVAMSWHRSIILKDLLKIDFVKKQLWNTISSVNCILFFFWEKLTVHKQMLEEALTSRKIMISSHLNDRHLSKQCQVTKN